MPVPLSSPHFSLWGLDPKIVFLNHGSFGACPLPILERQSAYRQQMELEPVRFFIRELEPLMEETRKKMAAFIGAAAGDLVFVQNATAAVNTVFRSLQLNPGDEILITNHTYPACRRVVEFVCIRTGARIREAIVPFPLKVAGQVTETVMEAVTSRTRIALIDHITSPTALIFPVHEIVGELNRLGIDTLVDGAHALGSIPLELESLGAAYYTANCHKWLCAPKSAAILHVRKDKQTGLIPLTISHAGAEEESFTERFYWPATYDPSPVLCAADTIAFGEKLLPGGWKEWMEQNHSLVTEARKGLCEKLEINLPVPENLIAPMATIPLPTPRVIPRISYKGIGPFQELLYKRYHIEVPVWFWGDPPRQILRISAQLYNSPDQYSFLAEALEEIIRE